LIEQRNLEAILNSKTLALSFDIFSVHPPFWRVLNNALTLHRGKKKVKMGTTSFDSELNDRSRNSGPILTFFLTEFDLEICRGVALILDRPVYTVHPSPTMQRGRYCVMRCNVLEPSTDTWPRTFPFPPCNATGIASCGATF